jgi:hypothetical protein
MAREETRAVRDHIVRLYYERYTCRQIAELTGMDYGYVRDALTERGITLRGLRGQRERAIATRLTTTTVFWFCSAAEATLAIAA